MTVFFCREFLFSCQDRLTNEKYPYRIFSPYCVMRENRRNPDRLEHNDPRSGPRHTRKTAECLFVGHSRFRGT